MIYHHDIKGGTKHFIAGVQTLERHNELKNKLVSFQLPVEPVVYPLILSVPLLNNVDCCHRILPLLTDISKHNGLIFRYNFVRLSIKFLLQ